ncbi:hypothetical protein [Microbacterium sp. RU33B]|uniref:hypothetical protein n=1 Tax=Microbacterium sp. RU33B TaxID=1907390 RepID=UPI00095E2DE5|nr:hypothetical protein [Microbacterium sp. RU33B]SIT67383.1 hypothetical protein SAMN05880545_0152 [Microbacterium sp. RU33B]
MSVAILTRQPDFLAAVAELPLAARVADGPRGAVVVLTGERVVEKAQRAQDDGAAALVVSDAAALRTVDLEALHAGVRIPLVIARPRVRPDIANALGAASAAVRAVVVEASATADERIGTTRDAVAWARLIAGGDLRWVAGEAGPTGSLALFERAAVPVTVLISVSRTGSSVIRAHTLGHERVEVTIDDGALVQRVERTSADGTTIAPQRFETLHRLTLRRALAAAEGQAQPTDLVDEVHDARYADVLATAGSAELRRHKRS